jgi:hypothetical protein
MAADASEVPLAGPSAGERFPLVGTQQLRLFASDFFRGGGAHSDDVIVGPETRN